MNTQLSFLDGHRDGATYEADQDLARLNGQMREVYLFMRGGDWHTLRQIADGTGNPEASVSARLRDIRKPKFGGFNVDRRRDDTIAGLFWYRVTKSTEVE